MKTIVLYGICAEVAEFDLRLARIPGFVERRFISKTGGCVEYEWFYDTAEAAEEAHKLATEDRSIIASDSVKRYTLTIPEEGRS